MEYRKLGRTGLTVSRLSLGTAEFGQSYGIQSNRQVGMPDRQTSIAVLDRAYESGINLFDTAPSYGCSEELLGEAFLGSEDHVISTKVNLPPVDTNLKTTIRQSLESSLAKLRRKRLDIVKIHNATKDAFKDTRLMDALLAEKGHRRFLALGASVYERENALAAIDSGVIDVVQVAYNILDQRMDDGVLLAAKKKGVGVVARSVYLKGVLTDRALHLPESCSRLREAAEHVLRTLNLEAWSDLSEIALRFALSNPLIDSVLVGVNNGSELDSALGWAEKGALDEEDFRKARSCRIEDAYWLDPSNWDVP